MRLWFAAIGYNGEIGAKGTLKKNFFLLGVKVDYAKLIWEDIIHKLNKKTRENVVPYPRFISLLLECIMPEYDNEELTINPTRVFSVHNWSLKPNQTEGPPFTNHMKAICNLDVHVDFKAPKPSLQTEEVLQGKTPGAQSGLRRKQSSKHTTESKTKASKSKIGQSEKETQSSTNEESRADEISKKIKLEDLLDLLKDTRSSFFTLDSPQDEPIIISDESEEEEEVEKDKDTHATSHDKDELEQQKAKAEAKITSMKSRPSYLDINQLTDLLVAELKNIQWELPTEFFDLPSQISSIQKKLQTLDSLPSLLNKVTETLNRFATMVENASRATTKDVPSAGQVTASLAEGENTNPATKYAEPNLHDNLIDLLGIDIMTQYYNKKLLYDKYYDKMLKRRKSSKITNYDVLTQKGPISMKVVQACPDRKEKGWKTINGLIKTRIEYLDQTKKEQKIDFNKPLKEQDPLNELNDLANKKRKRTGDSTDHSISTKKHKSSVQHEVEKVYKAGKRLLYVKRNKAISLGKGSSKVGIEVQQLSLKDCTWGGQLNADPVLEVENFTKWKKRKLKGQWAGDERKAANLDQRLKSLIMSVLPNDQMNSVINCLTAKSTWDDLILYHDGPSNVKESRGMDLKLCYNTFKFKEDSPDDEEDTRSSHEYLNDLEEEYQARALLAKSKRFFKKGTQRFSSAKATDQTECHKCGKKGYFARDCWSKTSVPSYQSPFQPKPLSSSQHKPELRSTKDFEAKYNKIKAKLALLSSSASAPTLSSGKNKSLIAETYEWDKKKCHQMKMKQLKSKLSWHLLMKKEFLLAKKVPTMVNGSRSLYKR
ncbi:flavonol 3-sulfotransferase-like protein [Tanacetum coccineum]